MEVTTTIMPDDQFAQMCEYIAGPDGINGREEKRIVKQQKKGSKLGKLTLKKDFVWDCDNTLKHAIAWMKAHGVQSIRQNIERIYDLGGHCDCEILFNVAEKWEDEKNDEPFYLEVYDEQEWKEAIDFVLEQAHF